MSPAQTVADVKAAVEALQGESQGWVPCSVLLRFSYVVVKYAMASLWGIQTTSHRIPAFCLGHYVVYLQAWRLASSAFCSTVSSWRMARSWLRLA